MEGDMRRGAREPRITPHAARQPSAPGPPGRGGRRGAEARGPRGKVDGADLAIGIVLLLALPAACYILAALFGAQPAENPYAFRGKPSLNPRPDAAEVESRWKAIEEDYGTNAKYFLEKALSGRLDGIRQEQFRGWARRCLETTRSDIAGFTAFLRSHGVESEHAARAARAAQLLAEVEREIEALRKLDILGRDE